LYPSVMPTTVGGMKGFILENEKLRLVLMPEAFFIGVGLFTALAT